MVRHSFSTLLSHIIGSITERVTATEPCNSVQVLSDSIRHERIHIPIISVSAHGLGTKFSHFSNWQYDARNSDCTLFCLKQWNRVKIHIISELHIVSYQEDCHHPVVEADYHDDKSVKCCREFNQVITPSSDSAST